nr:shaggy-related protein kinase eta isoform X3 [Ipomoea batatas]
MAERVVGSGSFGVVFQICQALNYIHNVIGVYCITVISNQELIRLRADNPTRKAQLQEIKLKMTTKQLKEAKQ